MALITYIFWIALLMVVYPYLIYPLLLRLLTAGKAEGGESAGYGSEWPKVTLIISAYNEAVVIGEKLRNSTELDYPAGQLEIMVISDASTDGTDGIVEEWAARNSNIRLVRQEIRKGKTAGLNIGVRVAEGDYIVFSDANAMYQGDAIRELVRHFVDPKIGYVMGAALYNDPGDSEASESEGLYWRFELYLKQMESRFFSVVGGDGAIYAIRKELYWNLDADDINDFVNPLQIVAKGYRGVFNPQAKCYEDAGENFEKEFGRKRRIVNRSWRAVKKYISWFNPLQHSLFLFELFSHKVIRWFSLPMLLVALMCGAVLSLATGGLVVTLITTSIAASIVVALAGARLDRQGRPIPKLVYLPYYFFLVNYAALLGIWDDTRGIKHTLWEHIRDSQ